MDGPLLKAKRAEEQGEEEAEVVEAVVAVKACESKESGAAAKGGGNEEENPKISKAAVAKEKGESSWGTIASAAFSNLTSAMGECDWLTLHRRMGHVALPILQQIVKQEMVSGIRVQHACKPSSLATRSIARRQRRRHHLMRW
ncbi:hypothetical protein CLOP_g7865 [Closterium sp. NIES-67]|nr:hypothetical protein CLOP_g7865 [Closterium sp. NIES-67]